MSRSITSCQIYYVLNLVLTIKQHDRTIVFNESFPTLNSLINKKTIKNEHGGKAFLHEKLLVWWKIFSFVKWNEILKVQWKKLPKKLSEQARLLGVQSTYLLVRSTWLKHLEWRLKESGPCLTVLYETFICRWVKIFIIFLNHVILCCLFNQFSSIKL